MKGFDAQNLKFWESISIQCGALIQDGLHSFCLIVSMSVQIGKK